MKKQVSNFLIFTLAAGCFIASQLLQSSIDEADAPLRPRDELESIFFEKINQSISPDSPTSPSASKYDLPTNALALSLATSTRLHENNIATLPKDSPELKEDKGYFFIDSTKHKFIASKLGLDLKHHFQNCFLVGYRPFEVSEIWMPHEILTMRLKYQLDEIQFPGFQEIWLSSYQTFQAGRGDCEDHSIALADWLIDMGEDARVVTGTHEGNGHAWVVVIRETGTFLIESTNKKKRRLWSSYPLATLAKGYVPTAMFNRTHFWINDDPSQFDDYTSNHWKKTGQVTR